MRIIVLLTVVMFAGYGFSGEDDYASWWKGVSPPPGTKIVITGQPKGGHLILTSPFCPMNSIDIETKDGESTDDVAQRLVAGFEKKFIGGGWGHKANGSTITVYNSQEGYYSMKSSDPGLVVPAALKRARAFRDEETGYIILEWELPAGVEKVSVLDQSRFVFVCSGTRYIDKLRKIEKGAQIKSVMYHLVSLGKQNSPGEYITVTYPSAANAQSSSGGDEKVQAPKVVEDQKK